MGTDIHFFREMYRRQKILGEIVRLRSLARPGVKKWHVAIAFAVFVLLTISAVSILLVTQMSDISKWILTIFLLVLILELYLRHFLILSVKCYQHYARDEVRRRCLCIPSCSEYAIASLRSYPLLVALIKIRKRLFRTCKGEMYKVDFPCRKKSVYFEKHVYGNTGQWENQTR